MRPPEILLISKPVAPPWNDSGKNLVRDLVRGCRSFRFRVLSHAGSSLKLEHVYEEPLYGDGGAFSPSLRQNLRVLLRLMQPDRQSLYHFFFAPNPRTSLTARTVLRVKRRRSVQTVMSVPADLARAGELLFADRVVVLSEFTCGRLMDAGVPGVVRIPPAVEVLPARSAAEVAALRKRVAPGARRPIVVFPGDYEFSRAAFVLADAIPRVLRDVDATFVYACRIKRPPSRAIEAQVRAQLAAEEERGRVVFVGETSEIRALLAAADLVVLPSESTYAKMDLPLVLLEALAEGTPILVADVAPLNEVLGTPAGRPVAPVGRAVAPLDSDALAAAISDLLTRPDTLAAMGAAGRAWVAEAFTAECMGAAYARVYAELLS